MVYFHVWNLQVGNNLIYLNSGQSLSCISNFIMLSVLGEGYSENALFTLYYFFIYFYQIMTAFNKLKIMSENIKYTHFYYRYYPTCVHRKLMWTNKLHVRDRPFNLQGGYGFLFRSEFFFRTTRELEYFFFVAQH
jgi:hypothetical protein